MKGGALHAAAEPQASQGSAGSGSSLAWGCCVGPARAPDLRSARAPRGPRPRPEAGAGLGRGRWTGAAGPWGSAGARRPRGPWPRVTRCRGHDD